MSQLDPLPRQSGTERTHSNAPDEIRVTGGLAMSLWMLDVNETDCLLAARMTQRQNHFEAQCARLRKALRGASATVVAVHDAGFDSERRRLAEEGVQAITDALDACESDSHFDRYEFYS